MSELYLPRDNTDSLVVIESSAIEVVDETLVKTLRNSSMVHVEGQRLITEDPLTINAVTGKHEQKVAPYACRLVPLLPGMVRMATSLRVRNCEGPKPAGLPTRVPVLCLYEQLFDRYVDVVALPEFGFDLCGA